MKYNDLIKSHKEFGSNKEDSIKISNYENILENVVIASWWEHNLFEKHGFTSVKE
jgi:hypothetical protein